METQKLIEELKTNLDPAIRREAAVNLMNSSILTNDIIDSFIEGIKDHDRGVKDVCARALSNPPIGMSEIYAEKIVPLIEDANIELRNLAADILRQIGNTSLVYLIPYIHHKDSDTRQFAIENIGKIGNPEVYREIMELLNDKQKNVVNAVIEALGNMKAIQSAETLIEMYFINTELRPTIIEALGKIGGQQALNFLYNLMKTERDTFLKIACIDALSFAGENEDICSILIDEMAFTQPELQIILLKTIFSISYRNDIEFNIPDKFRFVAYNALTEEDIDYRIAGLVALGCTYYEDDIDFLITEVLRNYPDTQKLIMENILLYSDELVIREFFIRYYLMSKRDIESIEFISLLTYFWDKVPDSHKDIIIAINSELLEQPGSGVPDEVTDLIDYLKF